MKIINRYTMLWLIPLLLVMIIAGCDDRVSIVAPPIVTTPTVSSTNPVDQAPSVAFNSKLTATFSESMDSLTITTATFTLMQGTSFVSGTVSYTGRTAMFSPSSDLAPDTKYTATITTGAKNKAGTALASNYVWSFTTSAAAVVTPPTVTSTDPLNAATGVALNQKIAASFSKTMDPTTITTATFTLMQGTVFVSGTVSYTGTTTTFSPSSNLAPNTLYTGTITTGAKDLTGNSLANNYVWNFTTGAAVAVTPPTVTLTDPANAATGVPLNQKISATFSKTMDASTVTASTFILTQGTTSVSGFVSYSGNTAIFAPASTLSANTSYTVTITTGAKDLTGLALVNNYIWSFTTGAAVVVTPPTVTSTDPLNAATNVPLNQKINATFSKTMDASTITASTFVVTHGTTSVSGFVSYSGITAIFSPTSNLAANTIYTAKITTGAKDLSGTAIATEYIWNFTTGSAPVVTPPTVTSTDPLNAAINVPFNKKISAVFSKQMDASTLTTSTFTLMQGLTFVSGTVSYLDNTVTYSPSSNLAQNTIYTATITTGAKDLTGNSLASNYVWSFTTATPYVISLSSNPLAGGITNGSGTFNSGSLVTVNATPNTGFTFTNWTENGVQVSTNASYTFTINGDRTLVANFALPTIQYTVTLSSLPLAGGNTSGGGTYDSGSSVTVIATPNTGYTFTNWTETGVQVSTNASYTFIINGNRDLVANFTSLPSGPSPVDLGSAGNFVVIAGSGVSNIGFSTLYGDVGSFPTATINGFPPGVVVGTLYMTADPIVGTAKDDLTTAYNDAQGRSLNAISLPGQLGGLTLAPGLYVNSTSTGISGTGPNGILTLDAGGNANAVWIFKMGSTLVTDAGTSIVLAGGANWDNIFWSVGSSATLGTNSIFYGNILADQSITLTTGATLRGRALTRIGAVTLESNIVDKR